MGRSPCCSKVGLRRGPWSTKEDNLLTNYIQEHGEGQWKALPTKAGLLRCGKSCRLRWMNYLRPGIKRGNISQDEEDLIVRLHRLLGNRWSLIAGRLPGRTDNEIKNYWNTSLLKKLKKAPHQDAAKGGAPDVEKKNHKVKVSGTAKANNNKKSDEEPEEINSNDPPKVYMPKTIRASSGFSSTSSNDSDGGQAVAKCRVIEEDDLLGMGSILPEIMSDDGSMWEKVFHEYLELL